VKTFEAGQLFGANSLFCLSKKRHPKPQGNPKIAIFAVIPNAVDTKPFILRECSWV
jgi:hypothetical protein